MTDRHQGYGSKARGLIVFWILNGLVLLALLVFAAR
ncbi:hypothetical protein SAMN05428979_1206 [Stappia sp. ES.058]|nr:hypothetical protein SAMN05428979_1206 [Stappia sp. ES.058]